MMICPDCDGTGEIPDSVDGELVALICERCDGYGKSLDREELFPMIGVTLYNKNHELDETGNYCTECHTSTELLLALGGKGYY